MNNVLSDIQDAYDALFFLRKGLPDDACIIITSSSISICKRKEVYDETRR